MTGKGRWRSLESPPNLLGDITRAGGYHCSRPDARAWFRKTGGSSGYASHFFKTALRFRARDLTTVLLGATTLSWHQRDEPFWTIDEHGELALKEHVNCPSLNAATL